MKEYPREIMWEPFQDPMFPHTEDDDDYENKLHKFANTHTPMLVGPMGLIPLNDMNMPGKTYKFWLMHTNFNLSDKVVQQLEKMRGVETLDIFTRYRARIGIGRVFDEADIMNEIDKKLGVVK